MYDHTTWPPPCGTTGACADTGVHAYAYAGRWGR